VPFFLVKLANSRKPLRTCSAIAAYKAQFIATESAGMASPGSVLRQTTTSSTDQGQSIHIKSVCTTERAPETPNQGNTISTSDAVAPIRLPTVAARLTVMVEALFRWLSLLPDRLNM
jgi:hypothetical protein